MRQEYDFSKGEHGKFFHENARLILPVYLEEDVQRYLDERQNQRVWKSLSLSTKCCAGT